MKLNKIILLLFVLLLSSACEDTIPKDYVPQIVVEALLIVGEPIQNIRITRTQSLFEPFVYDSSLIKDAKITITEGGNTFNLVYQQSDTVGKSGYYYPDISYHIKKLTTYNLHIELQDGSIITGTTTTPDSISWERKFSKYLQYPIDTLRLPSSDTLAWTAIDTLAKSYILSITCLDTMNYGIYLEPPVSELNRRTYPEYHNEKAYREASFSTYLPANKVPTVWRNLKWFGKHRVSVWSPDMNYLAWYMQTSWTSVFEDRFTSIKSVGAVYGFFGSAFGIHDTVVVLKNQK